MPQEIGMDDIAAIPRLVEIGKAAAAKLDWDRLLTAPDGSRAASAAVARPRLPRNGTTKRKVIKVSGSAKKPATKKARGKARAR
jgi:hypothetical protein